MHGRGAAPFPVLVGALLLIVGISLVEPSMTLLFILLNNPDEEGLLFWKSGGFVSRPTAALVTMLDLVSRSVFVLSFAASPAADGIAEREGDSGDSIINEASVIADSVGYLYNRSRTIQRS